MAGVTAVPTNIAAAAIIKTRAFRMLPLLNAQRPPENGRSLKPRAYAIGRLNAA
jgi:hypothetical protein